MGMVGDCVRLSAMGGVEEGAEEGSECRACYGHYSQTGFDCGPDCCEIFSIRSTDRIVREVVAYQHY
jgi:hypothetical protein